MEYLKQRFENGKAMRAEEMELKRKMHDLEDKKFNANFELQKESNRQQSEILKTMQEQSIQQQQQMQQQFQQQIQHVTFALNRLLPDSI